MSDYSKVKQAAEDAAAHDWTRKRLGLSDTFPSSYENHMVESSPAVVLALIAENEALRQEINLAPDLYPNVLRLKRSSPEYGQAWMKWAEKVLADRKDADRYRWLRQYTVDSYGAKGSFESLDRDIDASMGNGGKS